MRSNGWTLLVLALLCAGPSPAEELRVVQDDRWCREDSGGWHERARICEVREATLAAGGVLSVDASPNGGIQVRGWDRSEVRLRVKIVAAAGTDADARALAGQVQVETAGSVRAAGPEPGRSRSWYASYRLDVPRGQALRLEADNGGLHLSDLEGDVELQTVNGGLHLDRVGGHIQGRTVNGGIHLELAGSEFQGEGLDLRSTNGGVHLRLPEGYNARLEASTVNGGVHSDMPSARRGRRSGGRIAVDLGRGGPPVRLETTNGGLHITQR
jgi:hypothetical protein